MEREATGGINILLKRRVRSVFKVFPRDIFPTTQLCHLKECPESPIDRNVWLAESVLKKRQQLILIVCLFSFRPWNITPRLCANHSPDLKCSTTTEYFIVHYGTAVVQTLLLKFHSKQEISLQKTSDSQLQRHLDSCSQLNYVRGGDSHGFSSLKTVAYIVMDHYISDTAVIYLYYWIKAFNFSQIN